MNNLSSTIDNITINKFSNQVMGGDWIVYKKVNIELNRSAEIFIALNKTFYLNCAWTQKSYYPSLLSMGINSRLVVEDNFKIYDGAKIYISKEATLVLGGGYINNNIQINCYSKIIIGHDVSIGENVCIRDSDNHLVDHHEWNKFTKPVIIGNRVWIGMNVTILKGVTIGDGAVIGANSVVTKNIPDRTLAAGVPAKVIKENVTWQ